MRKPLILYLVLTATACGWQDDIEVIKEEPKVELPGEDGLTIPERLRSAVTVVSESLSEDGARKAHRYPGITVGDRLVLTSMQAEYGKDLKKILFIGADGTEKEVGASYFAKESRLWLLVVETSGPIDAPKATFWQELPKLGEVVYAHTREGGDRDREDLREFLVNSTELRYNGARFRVWPKETEETDMRLDACEPLFDEDGFLVGLAAQEAYGSHTNLQGYGKTSTVIYPSFLIETYLRQALDPRRP